MWLRRENSRSLEIIFLFFVFLFFSLNFVSAIRINEVEMNPPGTDAGSEWVELYSEEEVDLDNCKLKNGDEGELELEGSFKGYKVINLEKQWLDNNDEFVVLMRNNEIIDITPTFSDTKNNDFSWCYCGQWEFIKSSKNKKNECEEPEEEIKEEKKESEEEREEVEEENNEEEEVVEEDEDEGEEENIEKLSLKTNNEEANKEEEKAIILNKPKNIKSEEILYESKNERIKTYAIFGFAVFCILVLILLFLGKKKNDTSYNYN